MRRRREVIPLPPPAQWRLEMYGELEGDTRYRPRSEQVAAYEEPSLFAKRG